VFLFFFKFQLTVDMREAAESTTGGEKETPQGAGGGSGGIHIEVKKWSTVAVRGVAVDKAFLSSPLSQNSLSPLTLFLILSRHLHAPSAETNFLNHVLLLLTKCPMRMSVSVCRYQPNCRLTLSE